MSRLCGKSLFLMLAYFSFLPILEYNISMLQDLTIWSSLFQYSLFSVLFVLNALFFFKFVAASPGYLRFDTYIKQVASAYTARSPLGIIPTTDQPSLDESQLKNYCQICLIKLQLRSKHCSICNSCVALYDHHCHFIGKCIGQTNRRAYWQYLFVQWVLLIYACLSLYGSLEPSNTGKGFIIENWVRIINLIVLLMIWLPVTKILAFQSYLAVTNQTYWEVLGEAEYAKEWRSKLYGPFSRGLFENLRYFCIESTKEEFTEWEIN